MTNEVQEITVTADYAVRVPHIDESSEHLSDVLIREAARQLIKTVIAGKKAASKEEGYYKSYEWEIEQRINGKVEELLDAEIVAVTGPMVQKVLDDTFGEVDPETGMPTGEQTTIRKMIADHISKQLTLSTDRYGKSQSMIATAVEKISVREITKVLDAEIARARKTITDQLAGNVNEAMTEAIRKAMR